MTDHSEVAATDFEALWREAPCGLARLDARFSVLDANPAALRMMGQTALEALGAPFTRFLNADSAARFAHAIAACQGEGGSDVCDLELVFARGEAAPVEVDAQARAEAGSQRIHLSFAPAERRQARQRQVEAKLKEAELAASILAASTDAIFSASSSAVILSWNRGAEQLYGYSAAETIGRPLAILVPPAHSAESVKAVQALLDGQTIYLETERRHKDSRLVPVAISGGPIHDDAGRVVGFAAVHRDISAQIRHEAQLRFVMRELAHRTKNLLAIIQSIERQTARGVATTEEFHERFSSRLQALAASHDLLVEANWAGARIGDLIERQLAAFSDQIGGRILLSGPPLRLTPEVAQTIGLAVHELATNATKYGALSIPSGRVSVSWGLIPDENGKPKFQIEWRESGGPPVSPPRQRGFGTLAIERLAAQALNGKAELVYSPEGLRWTLSSDPSRVDISG